MTDAEYKATCNRIERHEALTDIENDKTDRTFDEMSDENLERIYGNRYA